MDYNFRRRKQHEVVSGVLGGKASGGSSVGKWRIERLKIQILKEKNSRSQKASNGFTV